MLKVFFKTFVICVLVCIIWTAWSFFQKDGFEHDLEVKKEVYSNTENVVKKEDKNSEKVDNENKDLKIVKTNKMKIYFLNSKNEIVWVERITNTPDLKKAIDLLLEGTTKNEQSKGIYSEIPNDVKILGVTNYKDKIIINLNSKFVRGGGTTTILNRIKQLKKTVDEQSGKKPIYLQIEGKQVEYIGGDGVFLEQPLNENVL
ncbi:MAG: hypothetical protein E7Z91_00845 [Cyanobacteria bacterium SIG30]|nr:hypothetical protein [Cyanobacteria bacterium SIG30]